MSTTRRAAAKDYLSINRLVDVDDGHKSKDVQFNFTEERKQKTLTFQQLQSERTLFKKITKIISDQSVSGCSSASCRHVGPDVDRFILHSADGFIYFTVCVRRLF